MTAQVLQFVVAFESTGPCANCGIEVVLPRHLCAERRRDHKSFYCPNGHSLSFQSETEEERLKKRLAAKEQAAERYLQEIDRLSRSRDAYKGKMTEIKNRISNGVCPCCKRSFTNVRRHMASKHPEFKETP